MNSHLKTYRKNRLGEAEQLMLLEKLTGYQKSGSLVL